MLNLEYLTNKDGDAIAMVIPIDRNDGTQAPSF